jgi:ubiquinone/menaquinone biosynthesis C-methylase UbiE
MSSELESAVSRHYGRGDIKTRILDALKDAGADLDRLKLEDLAPVDEFHIGGRAATEYILAKIPLGKDHHVLDIGCGIGGAARFVASASGCRVTGIDLTPEYIDAANALTERVGLADRVRFETASALALPFEDRSFDAAITIHVAMNIKDRPALYREAARVLKPGAMFCVYDVMKCRSDDVSYPTPWADTPATSHLTSPDEMQALLKEAGFSVVEVEDRTSAGIEFFRQRLAPSPGGPPPVGLHLLLGPQARVKLENVLKGLEDGSLAPVIMIARRAA